MGCCFDLPESAAERDDSDLDCSDVGVIHCLRVRESPFADIHDHDPEVDDQAVHVRPDYVFLTKYGAGLVWIAWSPIRANVLLRVEYFESTCEETAIDTGIQR